MGNIFDYLAWRSDLDFTASPFNPVDNIIFSQLSYLTLDGIVPSPEDKDGISIGLAVRIYDEKINSPSGIKLSSIFKEDPQLIRALSSSKRFGNCQLFGFVNHVDEHNEIQFSALCIDIGDGSSFVAFRGTDTSLVGWKEDFNMSFKETIPSQLEAVNYLEKMAPMINGHLRLGGHSKGGNLAIYAAANCDKRIKHRITDIYSNDAPGFHEKVISSAGFTEIKSRIHSYIPQSSVIGILLEHGTEFKVIKSSEIGLMQHSLYTWEVTHNDLIRVDEIASSSLFVDKTVRQWLSTLDNDQRERFIDAIYQILNRSDVKSRGDLESSWLVSVGRIIKSIGNTDEAARKLILKAIAELFFSAGRNIDTLFKKKNNE